MNSILAPARPAAQLPFLLPWILSQPCKVARRHESSSRRTTKRLRTKTDLSFTASISRSHVRDHIVFNPPSSAPSPYQTPAAFLPANDPRRELRSQSHEHYSPHDDPGQRLPPPLRITQPKKYNLQPEEISEIRRLRDLDPFKHSRKKLAERFGCTQFFVGMVAPTSNKKKDHEDKILEQIKSRWGKRRTQAREDRGKRRELWGRDE